VLSFHAETSSHLLQRSTPPAMTSLLVTPYAAYPFVYAYSYPVKTVAHLIYSLLGNVRPRSFLTSLQVSWALQDLELASCTQSTNDKAPCHRFVTSTSILNFSPPEQAKLLCDFPTTERISHLILPYSGAMPFGINNPLPSDMRSTYLDSVSRSVQLTSRRRM
jgi:hypothetical protein